MTNEHFNPLHSERPKLYAILVFLSAIGLIFVYLQDLMETIETAEPKITALKKCAHQLQKGLPTAEAKVQSQDIVMAMLEKYERWVV